MNHSRQVTAYIGEGPVREMYRKLTRLLIDKNISITTMESATSGQIASLITDTEGASAIMKGAFVTYSNEAKIKMGVPAEVIEKYGVYSEETAAAMAETAADIYGADLAVGITGTMGNVDPANGDSVPGNVYFAICSRGRTATFIRQFAPMPDRLAYKLAVAREIAVELMEML